MAKTLIDRLLLPLLFVVAAVVVSFFVVDLNLCDEDVTEVIVERVVAKIEEPPTISPYDDIFKEVGAANGIDWLLLAAIARSESEFHHKAVSRSGAVGLMQIMPYVAASMGVQREELFDAKRNVEVAAQLLLSIEGMFRFKEGGDVTEQLRLVLAAYNAGYSRVGDARRLARYFKDDDLKWSVVASYLEMLCEEEYFSHEVVKYGAFYGSAETIAYVRKVMRVYKRYKQRLKGA